MVTPFRQIKNCLPQVPNVQDFLLMQPVHIDPGIATGIKDFFADIWNHSFLQYYQRWTFRHSNCFLKNTNSRPLSYGSIFDNGNNG